MFRNYLSVEETPPHTYIFGYTMPPENVTHILRIWGLVSMNDCCLTEGEPERIRDRRH